MGWIVGLVFLAGVFCVLVISSLFMGTMFPSAILAIIGIVATVVIYKLVVAVRRRYRLKKDYPRAKVVPFKKD